MYVVAIAAEDPSKVDQIVEEFIEQGAHGLEGRQGPRDKPVNVFLHRGNIGVVNLDDCADRTAYDHVIYFAETPVTIVNDPELDADSIWYFHEADGYSFNDQIPHIWQGLMALDKSRPYSESRSRRTATEPIEIFRQSPARYLVRAQS